MLALVCVGAFTGRGRGRAYLGGANSLVPSFRRSQPDVDIWGRVVRSLLKQSTILDLVYVEESAMLSTLSQSSIPFAERLEQTVG